MITLNVSVGTASSCNVNADGTPVTCTYTASTGTCSFSLAEQHTNIVVTAVNWTSGGTGVATKATLWENKKWAYSFTFDDGYATDYTVDYPMFSAKNMRAGMAIVTGWIGGGNYMSRTQLNSLFNSGWSVFNHSTTHPQNTINCSNLATYVGAAKTTLESWFPNNYKNIYYVYPYLETGYETCLSTAGYVHAAEGVDGLNYADNFSSTNFFNLYRHGLYASVTSSQANAWADAAASSSRPAWMIVFTHMTYSGSSTPGTYDTNESTLQAHINYVYSTYGEGGANNNMWFAPSDEVLMYLYTRQYLVINQGTVSTPVNTPTAIVPTLTPTKPAPTNTNTGTPTVPTATPTTPAPTNTPIIPTATPTSPAVSSTWRVNAGGTAYTDAVGNVWAADEDYSGGTADTQAVGTPVAGTSDQTLYQSERYGNPFTYTFNVPAGSYQVTLKFADIYKGITAAGQRVFNVSINGTQVETNLDIYAEAGSLKADDKVLNNIAPVNGVITIQFGPSSVDNAQICAIQIISQPIAPTATPTYTITQIVSTLTSTNTPIAPTMTPTTQVPTNTPTSPAQPTNTSTQEVSTLTSTNTPIVPTATPTTPVPTNTPIVPTATPTVFSGSGALTVYLQSAVTTNSTNSPHPQIEVVNTGTTALNLNNVEVRYWFNCDCTGQSVQTWVDWAGLVPAGNSVTGNIQTTVVPTRLGGQTNYISYKFTGGLVLQPGQKIEIQSRFNLSDWSNMLQNNDWSYAAYTAFTTSSKTTGYINGTLMWGNEPSSASSQTAQVSNVMSYPNPSTSATGATLAYSVSAPTGTGVSAAANGTADAVSIPVSGTIRVSIYTASGRMIWSKTLDDPSSISVGQHSIYWNGKAAGGQNLASGTYILKVSLLSNGGASNGYSTIIMFR
jgi:peptidoglycan/xylan/chitin deacetylase (PgdA/CDA1 family)